MSAAVPYQVAWQWAWQIKDGSTTVYHDDVEATTAVRAMNKVFKYMSEEYSVTRRDFVVLEVYRI